MRIIAASVFLALTGCGPTGGGSTVTVTPITAPCPPAPPTKWEFQCSVGMPATGPTTTGETVRFTIPVGTTAVRQPAVHYLVRPGMPLAGKLTAAWRASIEGGGVFQFIKSPDNTCGGPPTVSLYFQRRGDDWRAGAETQYYRWYAIARTQLLPGDFTIVEPLQPGGWSSVLGIRGDQAPDRFVAALADTMAVGLTFGGGCFAGHGANVTSGTATFVLVNFTAD